MKTFITLLATCALALAAASGGFAAEQAPAAATPEAPKAPKTIPMNSRADSINLRARTFTMKRKDGVEVKHVITAATQIKQGDAPAKLEDIKVGDYVSGSRKKVSETEYTVVKITKFGPKAEKKEAAAKSN